MRGHVARKGSLYYAVVSVRDQETGARKRQWSRGFTRKRDAEQALTGLLAAVDGPGYVAPTKQTFGQFLEEEWLAAIKATVRPSTFDSYRRNIGLHVVPRLGSIPLAKVTPANLNALYAWLLKQGRCTRKGGLAPKTVRNVHTTVHRALRDAVRWGKLPRNPADLADPPRQRASRLDDLRVWSRAEVQTFLASTRAERLWACYLLALTTGMRRGELLGLRWQDVDLEAGQIAIRHTLVDIAYTPTISEPKTDRSRRTLAIDPATVAGLREHRRRQDGEREAWGPAWTDNGHVFTRENGQLLHPQLVSQAFERRVRASGVRQISFHDLRHTYATLALASGMKPWDLSDRLGHSSVAFTLNIYRHAIRATQDEAASTAAQFILGDDPSG